MHVQHSEQTARDQLVISQLPTDSAQVALNVESMPEQADVNSTTHATQRSRRTRRAPAVARRRRRQRRWRSDPAVCQWSHRPDSHPQVSVQQGLGW